MKVEVENLKMEDYLGLKESMLKAYEEWGAYWKEPQIITLLNIFPEGQLCLKVNKQVVGCALSIIVDYDRFDDVHTFEQITGSYTFSTHDPKGDTLYGIEVFIDPAFRGMRLARRLYNARKILCERLNLKSIMAGGRLPNFREFAETYSPKEYIDKVRSKEIYDPTLSFQLSNEFHVRKVLKGYMPGDKESMENAVLIEWNNIYYEPNRELVGNRKTNVRLGLIQWKMRLFDDFEAVCEQIEFFIDAAAGYKCDFVLFPEYFHAPLMAAYNHLPAPDAIRQLAGYTSLLQQKFTDFAIRYNSNIITGSMPHIRDGKLLNIGFLCRRNGTWEQYEKIHVTPDEKSGWGMSGGNRLKTFETDCGKIGVLICYDVEFPELPRILADQGMKILFVPFSTDTQGGYMRVRHCSMARAIENECFVAIAGSVGNLPKVYNMDIQFAQSAVFTPSDFSFPHDSIKAEATANAEMTLIVDVDLNLLKDLHHFGSVRTLSDRRKDLYHIESKLLAN
ncbi:MAG: bifunctional GNAT family N-acetyltransferase/carbon-nitrogen hydrolase family protein [Chitinophagales bacterium]